MATSLKSTQMLYPTLIFSSAALLAKAIQSLANGKAMLTQGVDYSLITSKYSKKVTLHILSGKMLKELLVAMEDGTLPPCKLSFPKQGMTFAGQFCQGSYLTSPSPVQGFSWLDIEETVKDPSLQVNSEMDQILRTMLNSNSTGDIAAHEVSEIISVFKIENLNNTSSLLKYSSSCRSNKNIDHRFKRNGIANTQTTIYTKGRSKTSNFKLENNGQIRLLTITEREALMGWKKGHTKEGIDEQGKLTEIPLRQRVKMTGNGIIPQAVEYLFTQILKVMR